MVPIINKVVLIINKVVLIVNKVVPMTNKVVWMTKVVLEGVQMVWMVRMGLERLTERVMMVLLILVGESMTTCQTCGMF